MYSVVAAAVVSWIAGTLFLIFGSLSAIVTVCVVAYLIMIIVIPFGLILLMRRLSKSPMIIRLSGEGQDKWHRCPDCSGDINITECDTCRGRGRLFTMTSDVENGVT